MNMGRRNKKCIMSARKLWGSSVWTEVQESDDDRTPLSRVIRNYGHSCCIVTDQFCNLCLTVAGDTICVALRQGDLVYIVSGKLLSLHCGTWSPSLHEDDFFHFHVPYILTASIKLSLT